MAEPDDADWKKAIEAAARLPDPLLMEPPLLGHCDVSPDAPLDYRREVLTESLANIRDNVFRLTRCLEARRRETPKDLEGIQKIEDYLIREGIALKKLEKRLAEL